MMRPLWIVLLLGMFLNANVRAEPVLEQFFAQNCIECHGSQEQNGEVRLDMPLSTFIDDEDLLETIANVLEAGEMPPEEAPQPKAQAVAEVLQILQKRLLKTRPANPLKRLTRDEYTNTIRDLFGTEFDFNGLLPPDHTEHGFDKFGEALSRRAEQNPIMVEHKQRMKM